MNPEQRVTEIERRLRDAFSPTSLEVIDESHKHIGHQGAKDGRGHFKVVIAAPAFAGMSPIARHRAVYDTMGELMQTDIHALSIEAKAND